MIKKRVGVLVSGRGSNLQSLIDAAAAQDYPAEIAIVISNRPGALALERAAAAGIAQETIDHKGFSSREAFDEALHARLKKEGVDLVCLAGFMRLLTTRFVEQWRDRLLNIHPSLLPSFKGLDVHQRMIEAGVKIAGCTVHMVRPEMDAGPIIGQAAVPVLPDDDADALAARTLKAEHQLYPLCLQRIASGAARIEGERVVTPGGDPAGLLLSPAP